MGRRRRRRREITVRSDETKNALGIISLIAASLLILSFFIDSPGFDLIKQYLGISTIFTAVFAVNFALSMFKIDYLMTRRASLFGQLLAIFSFAGLAHFFKGEEDAYVVAKLGEGGGLLGYNITYKYLIDIFADKGAFFILVFFVFLSITFTFSLSISDMFAYIAKLVNSMKERMKEMDVKMKEAKEVKNEQNTEKAEETQKMIGDLRNKEPEIIEQQEKTENKSQKEAEEKKEDQNLPLKIHDSNQGVKVVDDELLNSALINKSPNYPNWKFPPISLLSPSVKIKRSNDNVKKNADIIEQTLQSFGVKAKVVDVVVGPTVTQYALNIALGTKVSRISNLKTDLALALAAPTGAVRIEAPIPGTSYIGIEIPNEKRESVVIREIIESEEMVNNSMKLPISVGKSINGKAIVANLQKMPHLLVAGATGSGKSVLVNDFIISVLMRRTPDEVRMIMVDPKQVELYDYNGIPHLLTPVITDTSQVVNSLKWAIIEMEKRYTIFKNASVRDIVSYNEKMGFAAMPFILIIVDEMADLMLSSGAETETCIVRLAQKARATGIHLILATQRPSVDVLTGLIKANIPARIGLGVATQIDSRVILDQIGAEALLGNGDMLFKEPDKSKPYRIQGAWVSQDEVKRVVKFIRTQIKEEAPLYKEEIVQHQGGMGSAGTGGASGFSDDNLFAEAVRIVCNSKKGSASLLQRKLSIGYNRAARLLDELYEHQVVGPEEGSKPRKVLISDPEEFLGNKKD